MINNKEQEAKIYMMSTVRSVKFKTRQDLDNEIQKIKHDYVPIKPDNVQVKFDLESIEFDDAVQEIKVTVLLG